MASPGALRLRPGWRISRRQMAILGAGLALLAVKGAGEISDVRAGGVRPLAYQSVHPTTRPGRCQAGGGFGSGQAPGVYCMPYGVSHHGSPQRARPSQAPVGDMRRPRAMGAQRRAGGSGTVQPAAMGGPPLRVGTAAAPGALSVAAAKVVNPVSKKLARWGIGLAPKTAENRAKSFIFDQSTRYTEGLRTRPPAQNVVDLAGRTCQDAWGRGMLCLVNDSANRGIPKAIGKAKSAGERAALGVLGHLLRGYTWSQKVLNDSAAVGQRRATAAPCGTPDPNRTRAGLRPHVNFEASVTFTAAPGAHRPAARPEPRPAFPGDDPGLLPIF